MVTAHRSLVRKLCFKCHIYKRGLFHDLSKYSKREIYLHKYFLGYKSPIENEKNEKGYSDAWLHHMGKNRHHYEYWIDFTYDQIKLMIMPYEFAVEMVCDMTAAGKIYNGDNFTNSTQLEYFKKGEKRYNSILHSATREFMKTVFEYLEKNGIEKTFTEKNMKEIYEKSCMNKEQFEYKTIV